MIPISSCSDEQTRVQVMNNHKSISSGDFLPELCWLAICIPANKKNQAQSLQFPIPCVYRIHCMSGKVNRIAPFMLTLRLFLLFAMCCSSVSLWKVKAAAKPAANTAVLDVKGQNLKVRTNGCKREHVAEDKKTREREREREKARERERAPDVSLPVPTLFPCPTLHNSRVLLDS